MRFDVISILCENRSDIGSEYFEGDANDMIFDLYSVSSSKAHLENMKNNIQDRAIRLRNRQIQKEALEMNRRKERSEE